MRVYKVNKKEMVGGILLIIMLLALLIVPLFISNLFIAGMSQGAFIMFIFLHVTGISEINRERAPIEKIEVEEKYVKETTDG